MVCRSQVIREREFVATLINIHTCHGFYGNRETCKLAVLTAYFDESGIHKGDHLCVVAGFVGNDAQWGSCIADWIPALGKRRNLHMQSLRWKQHPERIAPLLAKLGPIPHHYNLTPVYCGMWQRDYEEIMKGKLRPEFTTPYMTCAQSCIAIVLNEIAGSDEVAFIFERQRVNKAAILSLDRFVFGAVGVDSRVKGLTLSTASLTVCLDRADYLAFQIREWNMDPNSPKAKMGISIMQGESHGGIFTREQIQQRTDELIRVGLAPGSTPTPAYADREVIRKLMANPYWRGPRV